MGQEYLKPMLDVGSPRVFNVNVMTRRIMAKAPETQPFFRNKQLNNLVLIKDSVPEDDHTLGAPPIGTKLYFPFNEKDIYEGGRTIFVHDKNMESALIGQFGEGALKKEVLAEDLRIMRILDRLPSLDPFLLKDVFLNEGIPMDEAYFEVGEEMWKQIETYILQSFEPLVSAAFPQAMGSDDMARKLIEKIWEARDLEALRPLTTAFQFPAGEELQIFSAWKGINFYAFQAQSIKSLLLELMTWLKELQIPFAAVSAAERSELKAAIEQTKIRLNEEWRTADTIIKNYQESYDKLFKHRQSSQDFLTFLRNSKKAYWALGNSLGKISHATYCWNILSKRFPNRKLPWESLKEVSALLAKVFVVPKKTATAVSW
jgi:hypothetical protein